MQRKKRNITCLSSYKVPRDKDLLPNCTQLCYIYMVYPRTHKGEYRICVAAFTNNIR